MSELTHRIFCPECGAVRIANAGSRWAFCPHGHGKLVRRVPKKHIKRALCEALPMARKVGRNTYTICGQPGQFCYRHGAGRRRVSLAARPGPEEVIARYVGPVRELIRVFTRKTVAKQGAVDG